MRVIPSPSSVLPGAGGCRLVSGTTVSGPDVPVDRFVADAAQLCGIDLQPADGDATITVILGDDPRLATLPAPTGVSPTGEPVDESYALTVAEGGVRLVSATPDGLARGLATLLQLLATADADGDARLLTSVEILDAPRFAWRELSVDLVRHWFPVAEVHRLIDLAALYRLNVLHLHLTDDQGWRIEPGRPASVRVPDGSFYTDDEVRDLVRHAADRRITLLPEIDVPGHATALLGLHPELDSGRNKVAYEVPGYTHRAVWLDPELPATWTVLADVFAGLAELFPGAFVHIGGDESYGMPEELYASFVRRVKEIARAVGKRPVAWQEAVRAGADPGLLAQYWFAPAGPDDMGQGSDLDPGLAAALAEFFAAAAGDVGKALAGRTPLVVSPGSHCYLDRPYADPPRPAQRDRWERVGMPDYPRRTLEQAYDWEPLACLGADASLDDVAGVAAAVWCETVTGFDDLTFLLLPRLPGVAERAWGTPGAVSWVDHRASLEAQRAIWDRAGLTYFDWRAAQDAAETETT